MAIGMDTVRSKRTGDKEYTTHEQEFGGASPWSFKQRLQMLVWEWCWNLLCAWTPKPFNAWRLLWLRLFGATIYGIPFVHQRARIQIPWNVTLHHRCSVGDRANLYSLGHIRIGRWATVAQEAYLSSGTHDLTDPVAPLVTAPISVGAFAFVAARAFVMPGISIGRGAVVGAVSVVTRSVPEWEVHAGNPARMISLRKRPPLRINIVQGAFFPVPPVRGTAVEKVWHAMGQELASAGCKVTHVSRRYGGLPNEERRDGVHHIRVPGADSGPSRLRNQLNDLRYAFRVRKVLPPADITVTNTFWMPRLLRDEHGLNYVHVARFPKGQMWLYKQAARLQPVSEVVAEAIRQQTPAVAHLVKPLANPLPKGWLANAVAPVEGKLMILFVGRVHPEKGVDLLVEAFARMAPSSRAQCSLAVVGAWASAENGGGEEYFNSLTRRADELGIDVTWVGPIYDAEVLRAQYDRAEIFVYPSIAARGEALPLAPVEAMGRGCLPVTSALRCFDDYLSHGHNGWTFPCDTGDAAQALATALEHLAGDADLRLALRRRALETAARFTVEQIAQQYLQDFESLVYE